MSGFLKGLMGAAALSGAVANAAGYEKSIMWGGRAAGVAGIATPYTQGSEALYWNPAGLVSERQGHDLSFNVSPTWAQFSGPIAANNTTADGERTLSAPVSLMFGNTLNEKWGYGVGFYVSGGSQALFKDTGGWPAGGPTDTRTDLKIYELALGGAYRVNEKLKLGLAWRVVQAQADFTVVAVENSGFGPASLDASGLEATNYMAFKAGAQYQLSEKTALSLVYRSEVNLEAEGGTATPSGPGALVGALGGGTPRDAEAATTFPMAVTLGAQHQFNSNWRGLTELVWTQYSRVNKVRIEREGASTVDLMQNWKDQWNLRFGGEYLGYAMPIRFGYGFTSKVTDESYARATFTPPGDAHTLTVGTGKTFGESFRFDGGLEYTLAAGSSGGNEQAGAVTDIRAGDYEATSYAIHLGVSYLF